MSRHKPSVFAGTMLCLIFTKRNKKKYPTSTHYATPASCKTLSGCTASQQTAPRTATPAAVPKEVVHPKCSAIHGVKEAVNAPPSCPPILTNEENTPEFCPAISAEADQKELCERYKVPAPPARTNAASRGLCTCEPTIRKAA